MIRRTRPLGEYAALLLILVGVPLVCAWLGGYDEVLRDVFRIVPQTDVWQGRPERLWNCRCPFSWCAFALVGGAATALVAPFAWRFGVSLYRLLQSHNRTILFSLGGAGLASRLWLAVGSSRGIGLRLFRRCSASLTFRSGWG